ncbi:hypothetical protein XU18_4197 [Perkinsela sp. CCAP 1560/4]|nr:hypothetical protein XU18_4197 [Perkinsela sp. CCAP 1560/4]|eukprot:KNH04585.1 hypothetical protein XU18_4197 [Perkinsela sp. CCAP 1560/4]
MHISVDQRNIPKDTVHLKALQRSVAKKEFSAVFYYSMWYSRGTRKTLLKKGHVKICKSADSSTDGCWASHWYSYSVFQQTRMANHAEAQPVRWSARGAAPFHA